MRILFLILFALQIQAQPLLHFFSDDEFDPLTYDDNVIGLYDGDLELTTTAWGDQSTNNEDLPLSNSPTVTNTLNGHTVLTFNGTDENGLNTAFTGVNTNEFTVYMVIYSNTNTNADVVFAMGTSGNIRYRLDQTNSSPNLRLFAAGATLDLTDPDLALDTWGVITIVSNGVDGELRTNLSTAVACSLGTVTEDANRVVIGGSYTVSYWDGSMAYLIIRDVVDNTATQNKFINYLMKRFGL